MNAASGLVFRDRAEAGRQLAQLIVPGFARSPDARVLALPRGGVPVAFEVAQALRAPLDVCVVRKLGLPDSPEFAVGALASGGVLVMNEDLVQELDPAAVEAVVQIELKELHRREALYRAGLPPLDVRGRDVIVVDDGLATGMTMRAAVRALRCQLPRRIVVALPTAARSSCAILRQEADEVICVTTPEPFRAVGLWYRHFEQTSDEAVQALLQRAHAST